MANKFYFRQNPLSKFRLWINNGSLKGGSKFLNKKLCSLWSFLIVTHATPIKVFLIKYLGFSIKKVETIYFKNTSVSIFDFQNEKFKPVKINDYSHIKEI